jgi:hypothetical protein
MERVKETEENDISGMLLPVTAEDDKDAKKEAKGISYI